jgi:hypothetical protein
VLSQQGMESADWDASTFGRFVQDEYRRWRPFVEQVGPQTLGQP